MPIYAYRCTSGHEFELRQGFDASTELACPTCADPARRLISSPAVIYKGSGFYTTDYARKSMVPAGESKNGNAKEPLPNDGHGGEHGHDHGHSHDAVDGVVTPAS
ncbi:MAG: zinc ribbon domain-containing protein [Chloroflexi bacterium]|nr:zinc ribbon domain-containing protein [Chloroflexota bacterium]